MMFIKKALMAAGVASAMVSPIAASAAAPVARVAPASVDESDLRANGSGLILALVALAGLTAAYFLIEDNNDGNNRPVSP